MFIIPLSQLLTFLGTSILLALAPGPDNIFVITQSALTGRKTGLVVTFGMCTGLLFHTAAVACGLAALFAASKVAFVVLKYAGAAYLLYLAWGSFSSGANEFTKGNSTTLPLAHYYKRGLIMSITNPKLSIFFLAFLPQFADPLRGSMVLQIALLGLLFIASAAVVFGSLAIFAGTLGEKLKGSLRAQKLLHRIAGIIFVGLAVKLAILPK
jgi:threonine/homoserine/homoserine lactone efflux protein